MRKALRRYWPFLLLGTAVGTLLPAPPRDLREWLSCLLATVASWLLFCWLFRNG